MGVQDGFWKGKQTMNTDTLYPVQPDFASDKILSTRLKRLEEVLSENARHREELETRHPWVPIITRWIIALLLIILAVYFIVAGIQAGIGKRDEKLKEEAVSTYAAQQQAIADEEAARKVAEAQSEANLRELEATDCAKALYGIRLFDEKYRYTEGDFLTYLRSAFNRVDAMKPTDSADRQKKLHDVLFDGQYLASDERNTVQTKYLEIARKAVKEWNEETSKPCDSSYQFAELTESGIYLVKTPNADGYARRWWYE